MRTRAWKEEAAARTWLLFVLAMDFVKIYSVMPSEYDRPERRESQEQQHDQLCERCGRKLGRCAIGKMGEREIRLHGVALMKELGTYRGRETKCINGLPKDITPEGLDSLSDYEIYDCMVTEEFVRIAGYMGDAVI